jgi:hypothetical protein
MAVAKKAAKPAVRDLLILRSKGNGGNIRIKAATVELEIAARMFAVRNADEAIVARFSMGSAIGYVWPEAIPPEDAKRPAL